MTKPWTVPQIWRGATVVCIASGPSLTTRQIDKVHGTWLCRHTTLRVIAVNDNYRLAPWADLLYFCDEKWWNWQQVHHKQEITGFKGLKVTLSKSVADKVPDVHWIADAGWNEAQGKVGLDTRSTHLINGRNSGYQALHLAVHLGAKRLVLLGYDMKPGPKGETHWFGEHRNEKGEEVLTAANVILGWAKNFNTLVEPLAERGIEVVNATPGSAIEAFPRMSLEAALCKPDSTLKIAARSTSSRSASASSY